ncbi:MAG: LysE family translocator [Hyphomicrobiaceae bacterium]|nr:LysE family translocator [Hyphomicrobiaceae bacterium]
MSWEFLLTSLVIVATPGTGAIYTVAAGLSHGWRAGVLAAFASTIGVVPHVAAAILGLATLLHSSAVAFELVRYAGVAYLLWMAWQSLRGAGALAITAKKECQSVRRVLVDGLLLNVLNPKLSIFFVAFLPQFVQSDETSPLMRMLELSGVFMLMTFVVFAMYGMFAAAIRTKVFERPGVVRRMQQGFAAAFGAMAVRLVVQER